MFLNFPLRNGAQNGPSSLNHEAIVSIVKGLELLMSLSDVEIREAVRAGEFAVRPRIGRLNPAGVDLRIGRGAILQPREQLLVASLERVELSKSLLGTLHIRSSLAREGVFASLALVDPGFRGQLTVSLYNAGERPVNIRRGERFIQLSLFKLGKPAGEGYEGRYQDSQGIVSTKRRRKSYSRRTESVIQGGAG